MSSKYQYNDEAVNNLRIEDTSILDRLIDHDSAREAHLKKRHDKFDKRLSLQDAIARYVNDGDIVAETGFGYVRTPLQAYYEIIRQGKRNLQWIGSPVTNQSYMHTTFATPDQPGYVHTSYVGCEMRGTDRGWDRQIKDGSIRILSDWSHGTMGQGFKAAQFGMPFVASKQMLASDMIKYNPYVKVIDDPWYKEQDPVVMIPALHPDVTIVHCQQADMNGNGKIMGPPVNDIALAYASRHVILTCEEVVPELEMRFNTKDNVIPFMLVDAVVELPWGCLPGSCPGYYYWSREWWEYGVRVGNNMDKHGGRTADYYRYWINDTKDNYDFVDKLNASFGGVKYIDSLRRLQRGEEYLAEDKGLDFDYPQVIPIWE
ncbi:MAG: CoA transferase subunit A [Methylocystaceae bacterium]